MKQVLYIILFLISFQGVAQEPASRTGGFADKEYYLVDGLVLSDLTPGDNHILDSCLEMYHTATSDIDKVIALEGISENLMDNSWEKYQFLQFKIISENLKDSLPLNQKIKYINYFSGAISNIANIYTYEGNYDKAIKYINIALLAKEKYAPVSEIIESLMGLSYMYMMTGEIEKAKPLLKECIEKSKAINDTLGVGTAFQNLGYSYERQGKYEEAINAYEEGLYNYRLVNYQKGIGESLLNLGGIHLGQKDYLMAIKYINQGIEVLKKIGFLRGLSTGYNNLGAAYKNSNDIPNAIKNFNKGLEIQEKTGDERGAALSINNIAFAYYSQKKLHLAIDWYKRSLELYTKLDDSFGKGVVNNGLANSYLLLYKETNDMTHFIQAKKYSTISYAFGQETGYPNLIRDASLSLSKIYAIENKGLKALDLYKESIQMMDSLNNESTQKAAIHQQAKYEYEKQKVIDDAENEKLIAIEKEAKEKQQVITYAIGTGLGLVGIFLFFVFNRLQVTRKQKKVIEEQKDEVELQKEVVEEAHHELEEKNQEIMDSITYAKRIQSAILPPNKVVKEYLQESFILYKPKDIVAGDFYWLEHTNDKVLFAAADCTGHGVPGAMVSVVCNNGLNRSVREYGLTSPGEILDKTREIVVQEFEKSEEEVKDGMDIALCSLEGNKLQYAGAHNPLWIIRSQSHSGLDRESTNNEETLNQVQGDGYILYETKANKQPIGQFDNPEPYTTHSFELEKGDSIYIFSDGYVDQFGGEKGKKFKAKAFRKLLLSIQDKTMEEQKIIIDESFETWRGSLEQIDDVCIIGVRI
jgi:serine phosphatase RsbU (regulator of sigma subunit)